jgi:hypothetical protein
MKSNLKECGSESVQENKSKAEVAVWPYHIFKNPIWNSG